MALEENAIKCAPIWDGVPNVVDALELYFIVVVVVAVVVAVEPPAGAEASRSLLHPPPGPNPEPLSPLLVQQGQSRTCHCRCPP